MHFLTPPHYSNSQNSIVSFKYVDSYPKIFLILYPLFENSTTRIAIPSNQSHFCNANHTKNDNCCLKIYLTGNNKEYGFLTVMDIMSTDEECPCDEIQTDIRFLKMENIRRQGEIELLDTRLDTIENPVWFDAYR